MKQSKFYQIKNITEYEYTLVGCDGSVITRPIRDVDKSASAFTIQDAKEGDVLATKAGSIFIYKELLYDKPFAYCGVDKFGVFKDCNRGNGLDWTPYLSNVTPATKEQCDTLMKAMTGAGYTFDFEKKELKRIKQKPIERHREVGHINELGNPEYKVEIFTDGKVQNPRNIHYMDFYKVGE